MKFTLCISAESAVLRSNTNDHRRWWRTREIFSVNCRKGFPWPREVNYISRFFCLFDVKRMHRWSDDVNDVNEGKNLHLSRRKEWDAIAPLTAVFVFVGFFEKLLDHFARSFVFVAHGWALLVRHRRSKETEREWEKRSPPVNWKDSLDALGPQNWHENSSVRGSVLGSAVSGIDSWKSEEPFISHSEMITGSNLEKTLKPGSLVNCLPWWLKVQRQSRLYAGLLALSGSEMFSNEMR